MGRWQPLLPTWPRVGSGTPGTWQGPCGGSLQLKEMAIVYYTLIQSGMKMMREILPRKGRQLSCKLHAPVFMLAETWESSRHVSHHLLTSLRFKSPCPGGAGGNVWLSRFCWSVGTAELRMSNA